MFATRLSSLRRAAARLLLTCLVLASLAAAPGVSPVMADCSGSGASGSCAG